MHVIGRPTGDASDPADAPDTPESAFVAPLGRYRARDGSAGARVGVDLDRPHAALVVGKRGAGKTHTLAVLAEGVGATPGVAPVVVDPMGVLGGLAECGGSVHRRPRVRPDAVPASVWPELLGLDPAGAVGSLVWRAVADRDRATLAAAREVVAAADAERASRRAADTHLALAQRWGVFDPDGLTAADLTDGDVSVVDCSGLAPAAVDAVCAAVARALYDARVEGAVSRLPWLLLDEAHAFFEGVAGDALATLLTRGRAPGVSLVCATQRPAALPPVAVSQADLLFAHRLDGRADVDALADTRPATLGGDLRSRLPDAVGEALVVDDADATATTVAVRERRTPDGGASARASDASRTLDGHDRP
ncbi:ATP-binding protein [Halobaculum lipolyticum]|uniref:ATP-binding protein n=1 Tax=Halobaculum lipolyticum TaxID=3032001 RepID=A0ABD5W9W8_9EURY|nr:ATPase [Halobaculum sp. DT31]